MRLHAHSVTNSVYEYALSSIFFIFTAGSTHLRVLESCELLHADTQYSLSLSKEVSCFHKGIPYVIVNISVLVLSHCAPDLLSAFFIKNRNLPLAVNYLYKIGPSKRCWASETRLQTSMLHKFTLIASLFPTGSSFPTPFGFLRLFS